MAIGNRKSEGDKGSSYSYRLKHLKLLQSISGFVGLGATEATLQLVLSAIQDGQDYEAKLIEDAVGATFLEVRIYNPDTQTWELPKYYAPGDNTPYNIGDPGGPVAPIVYINNGAMLAQIYSELQAQGITLNAIDGNTDGIEALLTTIDADTSNLDTPLSTRASELTLNSVLVQLLAMGVTLSGVSTEATLSAQAADIATIEANIALLNSKFNTLGRKAEAVSTSVAIDNEAYAALLAIQTAVQNIDSDLGTGGLALETTQVAGNGILTTIDAVLDASKLVLDSIDADTAAMVVDLAAIEVLITTTNSLLTTIDAVIDQIQTNTLNTVNELTSANLTLASILADTTGIKNKTDLLNFIATALEVTVTSSALPTGAATEVTLTSIDTDTGNIATSTSNIDGSTASIKQNLADVTGTDGSAHGLNQKGVRALGTTAGGNDEQIAVTPDGEVLVDGIAELNTALTPTTRTHNYAVSNGAGSVPAGSMCGSVLNNGGSAGTWNGNALPAGVSVEWSPVGNRDTYGAIAFDATGTEFIIEYTT